MSCKAVVLLASLLVGCTHEPEPVSITATAREPIDLGPANTEGAPEGDATYRWNLVLKPETSEAAAPEGQATATFVPDLRGAYVIERWLEYGVSDRLTHQFVIHALGVAPEAVVHGNSSVPVGAAVALDAGQSRSLEGLPLSYQWRLAERPRGSSATLQNSQAIMTSFVPDVAGGYLVELAVFDGELWSQPYATLLVTAAL